MAKQNKKNKLPYVYIELEDQSAIEAARRRARNVRPEPQPSAYQQYPSMQYGSYQAPVQPAGYWPDMGGTEAAEAEAKPGGKPSSQASTLSPSEASSSSVEASASGNASMPSELAHPAEADISDVEDDEDILLVPMPIGPDAIPVDAKMEEEAEADRGEDWDDSDEDDERELDLETVVIPVFKDYAGPAVPPYASAIPGAAFASSIPSGVPYIMPQYQPRYFVPSRPVGAVPYPAYKMPAYPMPASRYRAFAPSPYAPRRPLRPMPGIRPGMTARPNPAWMSPSMRKPMASYPAEALQRAGISISSTTGGLRNAGPAATPGSGRASEHASMQPSITMLQSADAARQSAAMQPSANISQSANMKQPSGSKSDPAQAKTAYLSSDSAATKTIMPADALTDGGFGVPVAGSGIGEEFEIDVTFGPSALKAGEVIDGAAASAHIAAGSEGLSSASGLPLCAAPSADEASSTSASSVEGQTATSAPSLHAHTSSPLNSPGQTSIEIPAEKSSRKGLVAIIVIIAIALVAAIAAYAILSVPGVAFASTEQGTCSSPGRMNQCISTTMETSYTYRIFDTSQQGAFFACLDASGNPSDARV